MKRLTLFVFIALIHVGCAPAEAPPTATDVPPTNTPLPSTATDVPPTNTPLPPTATSIPPTSTPNPEAEKILMEFSEAINSQDKEAALVLFAEGAILKFGPAGVTYEGTNEIELWVDDQIQMYEAFNKYSDFEVDGNDVTWTWFTRVSTGAGNYLCEGQATIDGGRISFLSLHDCREA